MATDRSPRIVKIAGDERVGAEGGVGGAEKRLLVDEG